MAALNPGEPNGSRHFVEDGMPVFTVRSRLNKGNMPTSGKETLQTGLKKPADDRLQAESGKAEV